MNYRSFFRLHPRETAFATGAAFFSSFGQTFFIALFVPAMSAAAGITEGRAGMFYAAATLTSGALIPWLGSYIDRVRLLPYTAAVVGGLSLSCGLTAAITGPATFVLALIGLRLCGQGLISHIAITSMAKRFKDSVGRALGITALGFPAGEAVLPLAAAFFIAVAGWRLTWVVAAVVILLIVLPGLLWAGAPLDRELKRRREAIPDTPGKKHTIAWRYLIDRRFLVLLPFGLVVPFVQTAVFFFQTSLGEERGWTPQNIAFAITVFAIVRALSGVAIGPVIDSIGGRRLLVPALLPLIPSLLLLATVTPVWIVPVYLALSATTMGIAGSIKTAVLVEVFGESDIGAIRALSSSLMIFSTAASPLLVGVLLEKGVSYTPILYGGMILVAVVMLQAAWATKVLSHSVQRTGEQS